MSILNLAPGESAIRPDRSRIALSHFCYRSRKTLTPQGPRKLPKLDVAGSTPVARSREFEELAPCRYGRRAAGASLVALGWRTWRASRLRRVAGARGPCWARIGDPSPGVTSTRVTLGLAHRYTPSLWTVGHQQHSSYLVATYIGDAGASSPA